MYKDNQPDHNIITIINNSYYCYYYKTEAHLPVPLHLLPITSYRLLFDLEGGAAAAAAAL